MTELDYAPEVVTESLVAIIACGGNCAEAHRKLQEGNLTDKDGFHPGVPSVRTLRDWKASIHAEQYRRMEATYSGELEEALISKARQNAMAAAEVTAMGIAQAREALEEGKDKEPARTALNMAKVTGQSVQEVLRLSGRPTDISASQDLKQTVEWLLDAGILKRPEGHELDVPDADVVEDHERQLAETKSLS